MITDPKAFLLRLFEHSLAAVDPRRVLDRHWPARKLGRLIVLGAGKAAGAMAQAAEAFYGTDLEGIVVTRDGYGQPTQKIEIIEASHPLPDHRGVVAAERILALAKSARAGDLVVCLWSGGASALMVAPPQSMGFTEKQNINAVLLRSGATIGEINCVRKHLSMIKGGRLAQACGSADVVSLIMSDVVGDDPSIIASGPTVADPTTCTDALLILQRHRVPVSFEVQRNLESGAWESPKTLGRNVRNKIVLRPKDCFYAAAAFAESTGIAFLDLGDHFDGFVSEVAVQHVSRIRAIAAGRDVIKSPCLVVSGGEALVRVAGQGRGGPNSEFILSLGQQLQGQEGVFALACDSDGSDGKGHHAGAFLGPDSLTRAQAMGLDPFQAQDKNDTATFFEALGDLIVTGPTYTNVNDFRAILVL